MFELRICENRCRPELPALQSPDFYQRRRSQERIFRFFFGVLWVLAVIVLAAFIVFIYAAADIKPKFKEEIAERNSIFLSLLLTLPFQSAGGFAFILAGLWQIIFARPNYLIFWIAVIATLLLSVPIFILKAY